MNRNGKQRNKSAFVRLSDLAELEVGLIGVTPATKGTFENKGFCFRHVGEEAE